MEIQCITALRILKKIWLKLLKAKEKIYWLESIQLNSNQFIFNTTDMMEEFIHHKDKIELLEKDRKNI